MSEALRRLWAERAPGERATIRIASALLALGLAYAYLWLPVTRECDRLTIRVPELQVAAQAMGRDAAELDGLRANRHMTLDPGASIAKAGAAAGVRAAPEQVISLAAGRVQVSIPAVQEEQAFRWVAQLQTAGGVRMESLRVTSLNDGNRVRVETVLSATR